MPRKMIMRTGTNIVCLATTQGVGCKICPCVQKSLLDHTLMELNGTILFYLNHYA